VETIIDQPALSLKITRPAWRKPRQAGGSIASSTPIALLQVAKTTTYLLPLVSLDLLSFSFFAARHFTAPLLMKN